MARDEVDKTKYEKLMKTIQTVRELTNENNLSPTFCSDLEKFITKEESERNKLLQIKKMKQCRKNSKGESSKYRMQQKMKVRKKKKTKRPNEKESRSSAEMAKTMEQRNTTLRKSDVGLDEEKLCADT